MKHKTAIRAILLTILTTMIYSQLWAEDGGRLLNYNPQKLHPDGLIGKFSINAKFSYSSVTKVNGAPLNDISRLCLGLDLPLMPNISLSIKATAITDDSTYYCSKIYSKIYLKNPQETGYAVNADGVVGWPVLKFGFLINYSGSHEDKYHDGFLGGLLWPVSSYATIGFDYTGYENRFLETVSDYEFELSLYTSKYKENLKYQNPDGPTGYPAFRISGGYNDGETRGGLDLIMPFSDLVTLSGYLSIDKIDLEDQTNYTAGIGLAYHFKS